MLAFFRPVEERGRGAVGLDGKEGGSAREIAGRGGDGGKFEDSEEEGVGIGGRHGRASGIGRSSVSSSVPSSTRFCGCVYCRGCNICVCVGVSDNIDIDELCSFDC